MAYPLSRLSCNDASQSSVSSRVRKGADSAVFRQCYSASLAFHEQAVWKKRGGLVLCASEEARDKHLSPFSQ